MNAKIGLSSAASLIKTRTKFSQSRNREIPWQTQSWKNNDILELIRCTQSGYCPVAADPAFMKTPTAAVMRGEMENLTMKKRLRFLTCS